MAVLQKVLCCGKAVELGSDEWDPGNGMVGRSAYQTKAQQQDQQTPAQFSGSPQTTAANPVASSSQGFGEFENPQFEAPAAPAPAAASAWAGFDIEVSGGDGETYTL